MHPRAEMFLHERARARARGDRGVERCMNVELDRMGYRDDGPFPLEASEHTETVVPEKLERAVPPAKGGRPKLPRCEHGQIVGRCEECDE